MPSEVSTFSGDQSVEELRRELADAREQQAATAEILRVISSSPMDLQRVFAEIAASAARLCDAYDATIFRVDGDLLHPIAHYGPIPQGGALPLTRGFITARVILDRQTIHIADMQAETDEFPEGSEIARRLGHRTILVVPLIRAGEPIGVISIRRTAVRPFTDRQIDLLKIFADQAVIAIENTRLFEAEKTRTKEVEAKSAELHESLEYQTATSEVLSVISRSPNDLQPVFDTIARIAQRLCQAEHAFVLQREEGGYRLVAANDAVPDWVTALKANPLLPDRGSLTGRVALERSTVHVDDLRADPEYTLAPALQHGVRSELGVPLVRDGEVIGVIIVGRTEVRPFTKRQIALVETFADQAVIAIENTRLFEEVQSRTRELQESLEYQMATSEVLGVISRSPTDAQPVFDAIAESARRLCDGHRSAVYRFDGTLIHNIAHHNWTPEGLEALHRVYPRPPSRETQIAQSILDGTVVHVPDLEAPGVPEQSLTIARALGYQSILAVPMQKDGKSVGAIAIVRVEPSPFSERQIELVKTFADQAVIAIENARLFEAEQASKRELQESLEQQTATGEILASISTSMTDPQPVFDAIVRSASRLLGTQLCNVQLLRDGIVHMPSPTVEPFPRQFPRPLDHTTAAGQAMLAKQVVQYSPVLGEGSLAPSTTQRFAREFGWNSVLVVPMVHKDKVIGAIGAARREAKPFNDKQVTLIKAFADQAVIAIENARLFEAEQASKRELQESLEYQTATSEVLGVISRSQTSIQPVFGAILDCAVRLCGADHGGILRVYDGQLDHIEINPSTPENWAVLRGSYPRPVDATSLNGRAAMEARLIHVPDVEDPTAPESISPVVKGLGFRCQLSVPMLRNGQAIALLSLQRKATGPFSAAQIELVRTFADQAVISIENAGLFEEVQTRTKELQESLDQQTATSEVLGVISRSPNEVQPVLDTIVATAHRLCQAERAVIWRLEGETFRAAAHCGQPEKRLEPVYVEAIYSARRPVSRSNMLGRATLARRAVQVEDVTNDPELDAEALAFLRAGKIHTALAVPLLLKGEPIGVISMSRTRVAPFDEKQIALIESFADQAVIAIENSRLFEAEQASKRELARSVEELESLGKVSQAVNSSLEL